MSGRDAATLEAMGRGLQRRIDLHRPDRGESADRVGYMELFFDLVFVYAITAQAQLLIDDQSATALLATVVLGIALWWTWISTGWVTNWLNPDRGLVRALLLVLMAASLVLSGTLGDVLTGQAPVFAITLAAINVGRPLFTVLALRRNHSEDARNFVNLGIWALFTAPFWVLGGFSGHPLAWWTLAVVLDLVAPLTRYAVPGIRRAPLHAWRIRGAHLSERVALFVLIALGESIALVGEHVHEALKDAVGLLGLAGALTHTVLLWFLFFNRTESLGTRRITATDQAGAIARNTYSYTAALLVMGIVLSAVATDLAFTQADATTTSPWTAGLLAGANVTCLGGNLLFRLSLQDAPFRTHLPAMGVSMALVAVADRTPPVAFEWAIVAVLGAVVIADSIVAGKGPDDLAASATSASTSSDGSAPA